MAGFEFEQGEAKFGSPRLEFAHDDVSKSFTSVDGHDLDALDLTHCER